MRTVYALGSSAARQECGAARRRERPRRTIAARRDPDTEVVLMDVMNAEMDRKEGLA
jgi:hypothetical protein